MPSFADPPIELQLCCASADPVALDRRPARLGSVLAYGRHEPVFRQGDAATRIYRVVSGAVKIWRNQADGERQIVEFHQAGDLFGMDGEAFHTLNAESIIESRLLVMRRCAFVAEPDGVDAAVEALLLTFDRAQAHRAMLRRLTAFERVCDFLVHFQGRTAGNGVDLPMSPRDIADYLGLDVEVLTRTMMHLQAAELIELTTSRRVALRNAKALAQICQ